MSRYFDPTWRTQIRWKRRFYAKYMSWLERAGYAVVLLVFGGFIYALNYPVDNFVTAEGVEITPLRTPLKASGEILVTSVVAENAQAVRAGDPVLRYVQGEEIRTYRRWLAARELGQSLPAAREMTLTSPADGEIRLGADLVGRTFSADAEIAQIEDFGQLRASASLSGQTVGQAREGQTAKLSSITVEPENGVLVRGSGGSTIVMNDLRDPGLVAALKKGLSGRGIVTRDDIPLQISDVSDVQVDATLRTAPGAGGELSAPPGSYSIAATVTKGQPAATVQLGQLPPDVQREAEAALAQSLRAKEVTRFGSDPVRIDDVQRAHFVVKVKADAPARGTDAPLAGSSVKRSFEAELTLAPDANLSAIVRSAAHRGKKVTAKVELSTGKRPVALVLLRKS